MFLQACVILFTGGGSASVHAGIPPPPRSRPPSSRLPSPLPQGADPSAEHAGRYGHHAVNGLHAFARFRIFFASACSTTIAKPLFYLVLSLEEKWSEFEAIKADLSLIVSLPYEFRVVSCHLHVVKSYLFLLLLLQRYMLQLLMSNFTSLFFTLVVIITHVIRKLCSHCSICIIFFYICIAILNFWAKRVFIILVYCGELLVMVGN